MSVPAAAESGEVMDHDGKNEALLRKYLLGELNEADQQALEEQLLADDELFALVLAEEDELVDDYLGGELSEGERERFDRHFMVTPERERKLRFGEAFRRRRPAVVNHASEDSGRDPAETEPRPNSLTTKDSGAKDPGSNLSSGVVEVPSPLVVGPPTWWIRLPSAPYLRIAATLVIALGLGFGTWRAFIYQSEIDKGIAELAKAYGSERPIEGRISGLSYAPLQETRGSAPQRVDSLSLYSAERTLFDEARENRSPELHHALGRLYLAEKKFDDAIKEFDEALKTSPKNARLQSDYGALLMELGKREDAGKGLETFARSLEHLNKALELNGSLLEALFNRAFCLEYMLLDREAEKAWKDYINQDPKSPWADEARKRVTELQQRSSQTSQDRERVLQGFLDAHKARDDAKAWKLISESRDSTGSFIENKLIETYLEMAATGHDDQIAASLRPLSYAGDLEYRQARDLFIPDLVRFYQSATPVQRENVLQARRLMDSGHASYAKNSFDSALGLYKQAREGFERAGDASDAAFTACLIGNCYVQLSKAELGLSILQPLTRTYAKKLYQWPLARTLHAICNGDQYLRDFSMAIRDGRRSLNLSEEQGDIIGIVRTRHLLAEAYRFANDYQTALDLFAKDLPLARTYLPQPAQLWRHYASISRTLEQINLYGAAIAFQKEALQLAVAADVPRLICRSYGFLGLILAKRGDYAEASDNIKKGLEIGNSLPDAAIRTETQAYSLLQLGYVCRKLEDFDGAIENYDRAIQFYGELDSKFFDYTARKDRLLCCMERGECLSVEAEMEIVLDLFEQHRTKILEESLRNTFFDTEQSIYDVAIEFEYFKKKDWIKAFGYAERSRGRSLGDYMSNGARLVDNPDCPDVIPGEASQPLSVEQIRLRMPEQARILQYAVLKNHILIWVVSKDGASTEYRTVSIEDLNKQVNDFLRLAQSTSESDSEAFSRQATNLYDLLIKPVERLLGGEQLCIVPDKILNYLPFCALISQASGNFFVQEHRFVLSPSSNIFILCTDAARKKASPKTETLLSVGNPLFDKKTFPDLANLRWAAKEAKAIADFYESPVPIIGASATKGRVMREMERSDVIHLATHAVADDWNPMRSKLLFAGDTSGAPGEDSDGVLRAYEIYKLDLARVKLVVLSACGTGVEKYYGGEGMVGLSRPFIAKQIPLVVATLWPVASESTARLMINFHRIRKEGHHSTTEALQLAQIEMLREPVGADRLPGNWASFAAIGGYAAY